MAQIRSGARVVTTEQMMGNAARAADFFHFPPSRVVELGAQVTF